MQLLAKRFEMEISCSKEKATINKVLKKYIPEFTERNVKEEAKKQF